MVVGLVPGVVPKPIINCFSAYVDKQFLLT